VSFLVVAIVAVVVVIVLATSGSRHTPYSSLKTGDCFDNVIGHSGVFSDEVDRVDCAKPHDAEVTGSFQAASGSYPGVPGFKAMAQPRCQALALASVGGSAAPRFRGIWLFPPKALWDKGTHLVLCAVGNIDASRRTGSVKAA